MNYFDIFRIDFEDLKIIAERPEAITTNVSHNESGYIGEIVLLGEYPERDNNILFYHEEPFQSSQEARNDINQIIDTITKASESTRNSEANRKINTAE